MLARSLISAGPPSRLAPLIMTTPPPVCRTVRAMLDASVPGNMKKRGAAPISPRISSMRDLAGCGGRRTIKSPPLASATREAAASTRESSVNPIQTARVCGLGRARAPSSSKSASVTAARNSVAMAPRTTRNDQRNCARSADGERRDFAVQLNLLRRFWLMGRASGDSVGESAGFAQAYAPDCVITPNHH